MTHSRNTPVEQQHTPGPWRVEVGKDNLNSITDEPIYGGIYSAPSRDDSQGWAIARVWSDYGNAEADARLIAAAPDLLAALEAAFKLQDGAYGIGISNGYWPTIAPIHEQIRAAIKKARGE